MPAPTNLAQTGAGMLMRVFDQARTEKRFDDERTIPPDGKLHRDEFPAARFDAIDRLSKSDGAIDEAELAAALARLSAADQQLVIEEAERATSRIQAKGGRFMWGFGSFLGGGAALTAGLLLGSPIGLGIAALGAVGILAGFGLAAAGLFGAGKEGQKLFKAVDAILGRAAL